MRRKTQRQASAKPFTAEFKRLGIVLQPNRRLIERAGVTNPASARLSDDSLQLYPRMIAPGNISRVGCFLAKENRRGKLSLKSCGLVLEPKAPYEIRQAPDGMGCEDPRITFIPALNRYVMAYVAFGPRGPEVAVAVSNDALRWQRLGLMRFKKSRMPFADKDAAFFPATIESPSGVPSLALYHRPTLWALWQKHGGKTVDILQRRGLPHEHMSLGYVSLAGVRKDIRKIVEVSETHPLQLPKVPWGKVKVGAGTPPVRVAEGWLSVIHGVDKCREHPGEWHLRYCAGIIIHDAHDIARVIYRSHEPLFVPEIPAEIHGIVGHVVFPTAIDPRPDLGDEVFDIYYGMGDQRTGRGRLRLKR